MLRNDPRETRTENHENRSMITLTEAAAKRVRNYLNKRGSGEGLRFGVKADGCSGWAYVVNYADEIGPDDYVFESCGVKVIVDAQSLDVVSGTEIDFVKDGLNESFQFNNPRSTGSCGCGESFSV